MSSRLALGHIPVKSAFYLLVLFGAGAVLYSVKILFGPLLAALLLTLLLKPPVNALEARGLPRLAVILSIYGLLTGLLVLAAIFVAPLLAEELVAFGKNLPAYADLVRERFAFAEEWFGRHGGGEQLSQAAEMFRGGFPVQTGALLQTLAGYASSFVTLLTLAVIVPFISFFLLKDGHLIGKSLLKMVPNRYFEMSALVLFRIMHSLQLYIRGQLIDASAVGVMTALGLSLIGFPYALVIGLVAGAGNLIPYLGPVLGFVPAAVVMTVTPEWFDLWPALSVVAVFGVVQFLEGTVIYPLAVGKSVELHPLAVIIAVTVGGQLGGIVGMVIAVPAVAVFKVTVETCHFYLKGYGILE